MCGYRKREKDGCFHHHGRWLLFSFHLSPPPPQDFSLFGKEISCCFCHLFDDVTTLKISPLKSLPKPKKKRGRSRHILLSVVSRSPGKLFKRTLTYCGKRTQRYVKREREREKKKRRIFSFVLPGVLAITRGEKWREEERNSQNKLRQPNNSSS